MKLIDRYNDLHALGKITNAEAMQKADIPYRYFYDWKKKGFVVSSNSTVAKERKLKLEKLIKEKENEKDY